MVNLDGTIEAPWCCRHCGRALRWSFTIGVDMGPVLVDYLGRQCCRPLIKHRFRSHELPKVERIPR